jgi:signal transduction histidine kinase
MRERTAELGGSFTIDAVPNGGTTIKVRLPIAGG